MMNEDRLKLATSAMDNTSVEAAEEIIITIITSLEEQFGDNQKTVAEELQKLARQMENSGHPSMAMDFKQRTTSAMLRLNMERRRGIRPRAIVAAAAQVAPEHAGLLIGQSGSQSDAYSGAQSVAYSGAQSVAYSRAQSSAQSAGQSDGQTDAQIGHSNIGRIIGDITGQIEYVCHASRDVRADARVLCETLKGQKVWENSGGTSCSIKFPHGPQLIIVEELAFTCSVVLAVASVEALLDELESQGYRTVGSLFTPSGSATVFASDRGSKFALLSKNS